MWERDRNRLERDLRETREARSAAEVEAEQVLKFYKELLEKPREEQWEWFENISQNKEALLASDRPGWLADGSNQIADRAATR